MRHSIALIGNLKAHVGNLKAHVAYLKAHIPFHSIQNPHLNPPNFNISTNYCHQNA